MKIIRPSAPIISNRTVFGGIFFKNKKSEDGTGKTITSVSNSGLFSMELIFK